MKYLLTALSFLYLHVHAQKYIPNQAYKTSTADYGFKGRVKTVSKKYYSYLSKDSTATNWRNFVKDSLDTAVYLTNTTDIDFAENGIKLFETRGSFFFKDKIINQNIKEDDNPNIVTLKYAYKLNDTTKVFYQFSISKRAFIYNDAKKLIEMKQVGVDTLAGSSCDFKYDEKGNVISARFWGNKKSLQEEYKYRYDSRDSLIEKDLYYYSRFNEFSIQKFKYDSKHHSWKVNTYLTDGNLYRIETFTVDESGTLYENSFSNKSFYKKSNLNYKLFTNGIVDFSKAYDIQGKLKTSIKTISKKWDVDGKPLELEILDELTNKLSKQKYEYKYDAIGNIIAIKIFDGHNKLISATFFSFEYY